MRPTIRTTTRALALLLHPSGVADLSRALRELADLLRIDLLAGLRLLREVMKVDPQTGELEYFARNRPDKPGPASRGETHGLERPVAVRFDRDGNALYIVDFGVLRVTEQGAKPVDATGKLWRITKEVAADAR